MNRRAGASFDATYGQSPDACWRAPGRVNLIGEHTDYNDGLVLPLALPLGVTAWVARRADDAVWAVSTSVAGAPVGYPTEALQPQTSSGWSAYVAGVFWALRQRGLDVAGANVLVDGDLPHGAGLSSSAALECAVAAAVDEAFGLGLSRADLVGVARAAENDFVGVPSGSLDQSASLLCTAGHALLLDTRTGQHRQIPLDLAADGLALLVIDTRAPHRLVDGEYAARRADCTRAAELLGVPALRDVEPEGLDEALARLPEGRLRRRVHHVVTENARVEDMVRLLQTAADPPAVGALLDASHASLRDDYEVSSPELDLAVSTATVAGAYGARMTGGGFGGSAIALVDAAAGERIADAVHAAFDRAGMAAPSVFPAVAADGAHPVR